MKNFTVMFMVMVYGLVYAQSSLAKPNEESQYFFLGIVVDSSPTSDSAWNIRKSRAIELISNLEQGDKVVVLQARPDSPSVYGKTIIGGPQKTGSNEIVSRVSLLSKELLFPADVSRACESIYDIFVSEGNNYKCLLVVLTSGKLGNNQVQRLIRTSSQIKALGGSASLTYDPSVANQNIITAGKNNNFTILLESNPDLAGWIKSKHNIVEPEKVVVTKKEYVFIESNLASITTMIDKALTSLKPDVNTPAPPKIPEAPHISEFNDIKTTTDTNSEPNEIHTYNQTEVNAPADTNTMSQQPVSKSKVKHKSASAWIFIVLAISLLIAVMGFIAISRKKTNRTPDQQDNIEIQPLNLKAIVGEQDIDLGDINLISELTLGSDPGCGIFIDDVQLSPKQARILKKGDNFKLQNLESESLFVNGEEVKSSKKIKLDLPADIQLPNGTILNLYTENSSEKKDENNG